MTAVLVNGQPTHLVPADDRGLLYGDGVFETIAFHAGRATLWDLHMARLMRGCAALGLPEPDTDLLLGDARAVAGQAESCVVRLTWTRGQGGRAYIPPADPAPNRIVMRRAWPDGLDAQHRDGIDLVTVRADLPSADALAGLKHLNRLPQVLIGSACREAGVTEALVVDSEGWVVEALTGNLVIERDGHLLGPGPHPAAVEGVGLAWLRDAADGAFEEVDFRAAELRSSDAIWVLNSVVGIRPVARLDGMARPPGELLRGWQRRWAAAVSP